MVRGDYKFRLRNITRSLWLILHYCTNNRCHTLPHAISHFTWSSSIPYHERLCSLTVVFTPDKPLKLLEVFAVSNFQVHLLSHSFVSQRKTRPNQSRASSLQPTRIR